ncbi:MAG TPA: methyltransferase domain-containing protein [Ktedonobacteraceae bacterium]|nr:methyltransferase domain-containing protein [Ktedonobacteraceae bacterium]
MTNQQTIDQARSEAFAQHMLEVLNSAGLSLMISIGHKTRLFDLLAQLPPSTSEQIAQAAGLQERYVREWLAAMVTGRIMEYDAASRTYRLPAEHAAWLTRAAGPNNLAFQTQYIALLASVQDEIVECFSKGGGVPYSSFPSFQRIMAEDSAQVLDASLLQVMLPLIPGLVERLQVGMDVADIGCGSGHAINIMAQAFPKSRFVGYDFSEEGIAAAQAEARRLGVTNSRFEVQDVSALDVPARYDLITAFDAIHDQARPAEVLAGIARALRPRGIFLMVDIAASSRLEENLDHPLAPFLYTISCNHCMTVSLASGGEGLGTMWGEELACQMLFAAGFTQVEVKHVEGDFSNSYYIASRD